MNQQKTSKQQVEQLRTKEANKTASGDISTRGVVIQSDFRKRPRTQVIELCLSFGMEDKEILAVLKAREPQTDIVVLEEDVRSERYRFLRRVIHHNDITETGRTLPLSEIEGEHVERIELSSEQVNWLFGGGLPRAKLIVLAGSPGVGKTRLACAWAADLTRQGYKVHYFQAEDSLDVFAQTYAKPSEPDENLFLVDDCNVFDTFVQRVKKHKPDMVVVDSVDMFKRSFSVSEIRRTMTMFKMIAQETKAVFLLIHHLNKQGQVKGSNDIEYLADVVLTADIDDPLGLTNDRFVVKIERKNRCGPIGRAVGFKHDARGVRELPTATTKSLQPRLIGTNF